MSSGDLLIGQVAVLFFFAYTSFMIRDVGNKDGYNEAFSMFYLLLAVVTAWTIMNTANHIAAESTAATIAASTGITYWVVVVAGSVTLAYFVLRLLLGSWRVAFRTKEGFSKP